MHTAPPAEKQGAFCRKKTGAVFPLLMLCLVLLRVPSALFGYPLIFLTAMIPAMQTVTVIPIHKGRRSPVRGEVSLLSMF